MRNNEYARRKYTLGEGANRRKKAPAARPGKTRTIPLDIWDGLLSVRTSASPSTSSFLLFASPRFASLRLLSSARASAGTLTPVFLFDKRILLEAIFTVSAAARNIVFVLNEIMIPAITR